MTQAVEDFNPISLYAQPGDFLLATSIEIRN